jgi:bifunctional enzyme CysN/CysC
VRKGDNITVLPSGKTSTIQSIVTSDGDLDEAFPPMAITLTLEDEIDVSRGDMITRSDDLPQISNKFNAKIVWMAERAMTLGKQYYIKLGTKLVNGSVSKINHLIDVNTLEESDTDKLNLNEIGHCDVTLTASVPFDSYSKCKGSGAFIIIDRLTNVTVAAGMIIGAIENDELLPVTQDERIARYGQQSFTAWLTGKTNLQTARELERLLFDMGHACIVLDQNQIEGNIVETSELLNQAGFICLSVVDENSIDNMENSAIFNCDKDSTNDILNSISNKAKLR